MTTKAKKILYVVEDENSAQFRYRVKNVVEALKESASWEARWVLTEKLSQKDFENVDLVIFLRQTAKDGKIIDLINLAQKQGIKVCFDLDDLVFDYKDLPILMKGTNSKNIAYWVGYVWGIRRIAKRVDGFITTNDFLVEKLKRSFAKPCGAIPNSLNLEQVEVAKESLDKKEHEGFVIGYFSGSPTHTKDLRLVEPEIFKFLDKHSDAKFRIVGYMELSSEMQKRVKNGQVEIFGLVDYLEQIKMLAKIDVNIAPLEINDFTNCKSELKFFEAAVVETVTVASPIYTFKEAISDGKTGFLAQPNEWCQKLEYVYNNPQETQKIVEAARKYVLEKYYGKDFLRIVESALESV